MIFVIKTNSACTQSSLFSSEIPTVNLGALICTWKTVEWKSALTRHLYIKKRIQIIPILSTGSHHFRWKCQSFVSRKSVKKWNLIFISRGCSWVGKSKIRFSLIVFPKALLSEILLSFFYTSLVYASINSHFAWKIALKLYLMSYSSTITSYYM